MKRVYLVTRGSYSDYGVEAVWSTEEGADSRVEHLRSKATSAYERDEINGVEEYWLDAPTPTDMPAWRVEAFCDWVPIALKWSPVQMRVTKYDPVGRALESSFGLVRDRYKGGESASKEPHAEADGVVADLIIFARDEEHALKIFSEKRAEWIAQQGVTRR